MPSGLQRSTGATSTRARSVRPRSARLRAMTSAARRSCSTNVTWAAPRDSASIPSAPLPANRSATDAPSRTPRASRLLKTAPRTSSLVGRVETPRGTASRRPPTLPATTRIPLRCHAMGWAPRLAWSIEPPGLVSVFEPDEGHAGRPGFLHGGLAATLLDETMAALSWATDRVHSVTATLSLHYRVPVPVGAGAIRMEAWYADRRERRVRKVHGRLLLP